VPGFLGSTVSVVIYIKPVLRPPENVIGLDKQFGDKALRDDRLQLTPRQ
jgi:hypothetical protein